MKNIFTTLAALAIATTAFAQTLSPASGVYYPADINNSGIVRVEFENAVENPSAVITFGDKTVNASVYEQGNTGRFWAVELQSALQNELTENGTAIELTVTGGNESVSGKYTYMPVFPLVSIAPNAYSTVENKTFDAVFTFNQEITYSSIVISSGDNTKTFVAGEGNVITVPVTESDWGKTSTKQNQLSVQINDVTLADGTHISNIGGQNAAIGTTYSFDEPVGFEYIGASPAADEATYQEVYDNYWYVDFMFTEAVEIVEDEATTCATVTFYDAYGFDIDEVELTSLDVYGSWNYRAGYYMVEVAIPEVPATSSTYAYAVVELQNASYDGELLSPMPSVKYMANLATKEVRKNKTATIEQLGVENSSYDVFSIDGTLVKRNCSIDQIKSLDKGVYIFNGKKIVVR